MLSLEFLKPLIEPLEISRIRYFVTGSIASIFYGEPRLTHDIDLVLNLSSKDIQLFPTLYSLDEFYCPPVEVIQIESKRVPFGHFDLIHHATGFKADIYVDAGDALHEWAFTHRRHIEFTKNLSIWLAPPEYVIIRKLEFFREGGLQKHLVDIEKMLELIMDQLDTPFLKKELSKRGLEASWSAVSKKGDGRAF